jgi:hypothetical protein
MWFTAPVDDYPDLYPNMWFTAPVDDYPDLYPSFVAQISQLEGEESKGKHDTPN